VPAQAKNRHSKKAAKGIFTCITDALALILLTPKHSTISKDGTHYFGNAKFVYLTGHAMARKLDNLLKGGEPTIHEEAQALMEGN